MMTGITKQFVRERLREWGFWLRTARGPYQKHTLSRLDSPLTKKRIVKPIYRNESAENLDLIMSLHMDRPHIDTLELYYGNQVSYSEGAAALGCSISSYKIKRYEAEAILLGILLVIKTTQQRKIA